MVLISGSDGSEKMTVAAFTARGFIPGKDVARIPMQRNLPAGQLGFMDRYTKGFNACGGGKGILCKKNWYTKFGSGTEDAVEQHVRDAATRKFVKLVTVTSGGKELVGIVFLVDPKTIDKSTSTKKKTATKKASKKLAAKAPTTKTPPTKKKAQDLVPITDPTASMPKLAEVTEEWLATASRGDLESKRAELKTRLTATEVFTRYCNEYITKIDGAIASYATREADEAGNIALDKLNDMSASVRKALRDRLGPIPAPAEGLLGGGAKPTEAADMRS